MSELEIKRQLTGNQTTVSLLLFFPVWLSMGHVCEDSGNDESILRYLGRGVRSLFCLLSICH